MEIIRDLRLGEFDVLVGINLLREGLDLPEVGLVAILDADKEGFLRSTTSLVQTIGRAARNVDGYVIMFADKITDSMQYAIDETNRRRKLQQAFNEEHGIIPQSVKKSVKDVLEISSRASSKGEGISEAQKQAKIEILQQQMRQAAMELEFEQAAKLRDELYALQGEEDKIRKKAAPGTIGSRKRSKGRSRK